MKTLHPNRTQRARRGGWNKYLSAVKAYINDNPGETYREVSGSLGVPYHVLAYWSRSGRIPSRSRGRPALKAPPLRAIRYAEMRRQGKTLGSIAEEHGVTRQAVQQACAYWDLREHQDALNS